MFFSHSRVLPLLAGLSLVLISGLAPGAHAQDPASTRLRGDVDGDGRVTQADAEAVRSHLVGKLSLPAGSAGFLAADANGDGKVTAVDAAVISRFVAGQDVSRFPVGRPGPQSPEEVGGGRLMVLMECNVDVAARSVSCGLPRPGSGIRADLILGKPYIAFSSSGFTSSRGDAANEDTSSFNLALQNKIGQPIGTTDGTTPHANGNRIFFHAGPTVTAVSTGDIASATIRVDNAFGTATFTSPDGSYTATNKPYFRYLGVLAKEAISPAQLWRFVYSSNVSRYSYSVLVSAPVQYEQGWITVSPAASTLEVTQTATLTGAAYDASGAALTEGMTWSSSNTSVATVNPSTGEVTAAGVGTATITATSSVNAQRTGSAVITVDARPTVSSTSPTNGATSVAKSTTITVNFSESVNFSTSSFTLKCPASEVSSRSFTLSSSPATSATITPSSSLPGGTVCEVVVVANQITDADTNDGPSGAADQMAANYTFSFTTIALSASNDDYSADATKTITGNVRFSSANASTPFSVTANDELDASVGISFVGWNGTGGTTEQGGNVSIVTTAGSSDIGKFTYNPPAGYEGTDKFQYTLSDGTNTSTGTVTVSVSGMIWFVDAGGAACTTRANGCGRLTNPYSTLAAFAAENNGTGNNPAASEPVFLHQSSTNYTGPVTLLSGQKLIGQDATASLSTLTGITPNSGSDALPSMNTGDATKVTVAGTDGINLGSNNSVRGMTLATTAGEAIGGTSFGTLTLADGTTQATDLTIASSGQALGLTTGTIAGNFVSVGSTGGNNNVSLTGVNSSGTLTLGGTLSGATGTSIAISGGNVSLTHSGNVTQGNSAPLLAVAGGHTGTLTFQTGTVQATNGTGLQFNNAAGTYAFNGTTTLNGGDAAIDITNLSTGSFTFGTGTSVTNPTGSAFTVYGSSPTVTYSGNLTKGNAGLLMEIGEQPGGSVTFQTGTLSATAGLGILLSNADGAVAFNGTTTLNGGDAGVDVVNGSGGTFSFGSGASITSPTNNVIQIANSSPTFTYAGAFTKANAGVGILVNSNTGGTITFNGSGVTKSLSTSTGHGVSVTNNSNTTVNFTGGSLAITTTSGYGFNATSNSGTGTVTVQGTGNTISTTGTGTALNVTSTTIGSAALTFQSISANGGTNGIVLNTTGSSGGLTVTGTGSVNSGGTIQSTSGVGISLTSTLSPTFTRMNIQSTGRSGINGSQVTNFSFTNGTINNSGTSALDDQDSNIDFYQSTSTTENNVSGVVTITENVLTNARGNGIDIGNGNGTISDLNISSNTLTSSADVNFSKGSGVRIVIDGSASTVAHLTKATIANNVITNFPGAGGINVDCGNGDPSGVAGTCGIVGSSTNKVSITGNRIAGDATTKMGTKAIAAPVAGKGQGNFDISNNGTVAEPLRNTIGHVIDVNAFGQAQVTATISGNRIQANNGLNARGIAVGADSATSFATTTVLRATISSNVVSNTNGVGISAAAVRSGSTVRASITNNNVSAPTGANYGIAVFTNPTNTVTPTVCVSITGNTTAGGTGSGITYPGIGLGKRTASTFGIVGLSPSPADSPTVENYVNSLNTSASGTFGVGGTAMISTTTGFTSCTL